MKNLISIKQHINEMIYKFNVLRFLVKIMWRLNHLCGY